ncbi:MAG: aminopeptidase, partial [Opitutales bacterium]
LRLRPYERMTVITDLACADIAAALVAEIEKTGAAYNVFVLEEFGARPHRDMPAAILEDLAHSHVSLYACLTQTGELRTRMQMMDVINPHRIRHGHMVNINRQIMLEGMCADFAEVDRLSQKLIEKCRRVRRVTCRTAAGTDFTAELSPDLKWVKTSGLITPEKWGNLPGGEIFTSPYNSSGRFVVDGVVGDYLCQKYGDIGATPLTIDIKDNRITNLACAHQELLKEFEAYCHTDENSNRVGEFAIGTNLACTHIIGHILQDEKLPGIHIAFGHPYSEHTGQPWKSTTHIDCVGRFFDIWLEDEQVMEKGRFLL